MTVADSSTPGPVRLPRTIKAIRAALPPGQRERFRAEVEAADLSMLPGVVRSWWGRAIVLADQRTVAALERSRSGELDRVPAEDALPDWGT
ncbi:hypothetical protein GCM10014719_03970 [Planomonospora parontospora subsp. antibiotica]|nr:hypothetical protein GCM10014719_03970 [Planomonospora parontospora subsp. antibiotica]GII14382.1 hypothetical protein Ppa05_11080 [Planomonospora parontospora subsp. antibiotica]